MHKGTLKKAALLLTLWIALHGSTLKAQIFTAPMQASTTGTDPVDFEFRADGTMIAKGNFGVGSLLSADQGDGTRLLWFPSVGAFRAGGVSTGDSVGTGPWDAPQLGSYSAAFGYNALASGAYSTAFGGQTNATGFSATVSGYENTASGAYSVTMGGGNSAIGTSSVAMGGSSYAMGGSSVAMGSISTASGDASFAAGVGNVASGGSSTALGAFNTAMGFASTVSGYGNTARLGGDTVFGTGTVVGGGNAAAIGSNLTSSAAYSFTIGEYNVGGGNPWGWTDTDPLFEVGNGTSTTPSDAFIVYKNGNADLQGVLTVAPGGDIPMYSGH